MAVNTDNDLYNEWAAGASIANPAGEFFQELEMNVDKPAEFQVPVESIPNNPTETPAPVSVIPDEPDDKTETVQLENGGSLTVEKTSRGWKATLDSGESGIPSENFYGNNKLQLMVNMAKGKLEATKLIRKLKKEKLLGGDEPVAQATPPVTSRAIPTVSPLSADDVVEIKNKLTDNPSEALDSWMMKRFGLSPEQLGEALKAAPEAKAIVESQRIAGEIKEVNEEFIRNNPDFAEKYSGDPDNIRKLVSRMAKAYLNKKVTKSSPQIVIDQVIAEIYNNGYWTADNLEKAKEDLIEIGELHDPSESQPSSKPQPQPVTAASGPSVPEKPRIAEPTGQPVGLLGISAKNSTPSTIEEKPLSDVDLQSMPMNDLRAMAAAQLREMQRSRQ